MICLYGKTEMASHREVLMNHPRVYPTSISFLFFFKDGSVYMTCPWNQLTSPVHEFTHVLIFLNHGTIKDKLGVKML